MSDGVIRAFKRELEQPPLPPFSIEPESLAAIDVSPSSQSAVDPSANGRASEPAPALARRTSPAVWIVGLIAVLAALVALARQLGH
jgi:hypothetical protein